ncbi:MAG: RIP metalloprotease RseP [Zetaproteobacteria bacterium]|nr:RIP metalloprotease RseP [Zetaproteobacteria bacterium]
MIEMLETTLAFIVAIALLVAVHEYGHFKVARLLGIKVEKFSIGFGPALFSWRSKDQEVLYIIALIPLGGYVKMLGEGDARDATEALSDAEKRRAFDLQPVWKRAAIAAAGPLANFVFAIAAYMTIAWMGQMVTPPMVGAVDSDRQLSLKMGDRILKVAGRNVHSWSDFELRLKQLVQAQFEENSVETMKGSESSGQLPNRAIEIVVDRDGEKHVLHLDLLLPAGKEAFLVNVANEALGISAGLDLYIRSVAAGSAAEQAGLQPEDQIVGLQGRSMLGVSDFVEVVQHSADQSLSLQVRRGTSLLTLEVVPESDEEGHGRIGVGLAAKAKFDPVLYRMSFIDGVQYGLVRTWDMTVMTLQMFAKMFSSSISADNLGGPIAIAQLAGQTAAMGLVPFIAFLAIISVNLGVLNLLPVPVLDGGHLVYLMIEKIRGKPLPEKVMGVTQMVGMLLIVSLMLFAFYNDVFRLLKG